jgi:hypothetical protein
MLIILGVGVVDEDDDENRPNEIVVVQYVHNSSFEFDDQHADDIQLPDL